MAKRLILLALALAGATATTAAQNAPAYCSELQQIVSLAMTKGRFSDIAGKPQQGDFHDTDLPLPGWRRLLALWREHLYLRLGRGRYGATGRGHAGGNSA